jgi:hypothetical protein
MKKMSFSYRITDNNDKQPGLLNISAVQISQEAYPKLWISFEFRKYHADCTYTNLEYMNRTNSS